MLPLVGLAACVSSSRVERSAERHSMRARQLEAQGDLRAASKERSAAAKESAKAEERRRFESAFPVVLD